MQQNVRVTVMLLESIIQGTQIKKRLQNGCTYSDHPEKFREASKKAYADHPEKSISSI